MNYYEWKGNKISKSDYYFVYLFKSNCFSLQTELKIVTYTVKPVYNNQLQDPKLVDVVDKRSLSFMW